MQKKKFSHDAVNALSLAKNIQRKKETYSDTKVPNKKMEANNNSWGLRAALNDFKKCSLLFKFD